MSSMIAVKLGKVVAVGTDSRIMNLTRGEVLTDEAQKLFEISKGVFFCNSGFGDACDWQVTAVRELAALGASDVRALATALDTLTFPRLQGLVSRLIAQRCPDVEANIDGREPLHGYILVGLSGGIPGFIAKEFRIDSEGKITVRTCAEAFELPAGGEFALYMTRGQLVYDMLCNGATWQSGPVNGVRKVLTALALATPLCGGKIQMAQLTAKGACWIHRPPVRPVASKSEILSSAAMATGVTMNAAQVNTGTLGAAVVYAGTINASQITWDVAYGGTLTLSQLTGWSGATITVSSPLTFSTPNGNIVIGASPGITLSGGCGITGNFFQANFFNTSGAGTFIDSNGNLTVGTVTANLPSSNPGAGTKKLWYDPSDGNRVKFAA